MSIPYRRFTLQEFIEYATSRGASLVELGRSKLNLGLNEKYLQAASGSGIVMLPNSMNPEKVLNQATVLSWGRILRIKVSSRPRD